MTLSTAATINPFTVAITYSVGFNQSPYKNTFEEIKIVIEKLQKLQISISKQIEQFKKKYCRSDTQLKLVPPPKKKRFAWPPGPRVIWHNRKLTIPRQISKWEYEHADDLWVQWSGWTPEKNSSCSICMKQYRHGDLPWAPWHRGTHNPCGPFETFHLLCSECRDFNRTTRERYVRGLSDIPPWKERPEQEVSWSEAGLWNTENHEGEEYFKAEKLAAVAMMAGRQSAVNGLISKQALIVLLDVLGKRIERPYKSPSGKRHGKRSKRVPYKQREIAEIVAAVLGKCERSEVSRALKNSSVQRKKVETLLWDLTYSSEDVKAALNDPKGVAFKQLAERLQSMLSREPKISYTAENITTSEFKAIETKRQQSAPENLDSDNVQYGDYVLTEKNGLTGGLFVPVYFPEILHIDWERAALDRLAGSFGPKKDNTADCIRVGSHVGGDSPFHHKQED